MERWCAQAGIDRGAIVPLEQVWRLSQTWYAGRLDENWIPRTPEATSRVLEEVGLRGDFWALRGDIQRPPTS